MRFGPGGLVFLAAVGLVLLVLATRDWDPMAFVRLGTRYSQGDPGGTIGYDGQFAYQIALHPLGAASYLDVPAYRYQRILYPLAAHLAALGQPTVIPWTLIALNILALTAGVHVLGSMLAGQGLSRWYAVTAGVFAGQLVSLRLDVNEPFAFALALLGIRAFGQGRRRLGAVYFGLSVLSKETALAFVGGYILYLLAKRRWRASIETACLSLGPSALWQVALWWLFGQPGLRSGGIGATSFSLIPFGALADFAWDDRWASVTVLLTLGSLVVLPCLALGVHLARAAWQRSFSPMAVTLALHLIMMATLPFSTYVDLPGMLRLASGLVVATLAYAVTVRSHRILNYSLLWNAALPLLTFVM